jgi:hypothetical protein
VIGSSAEEVRAWLVRVGVDEVRTFLFWTVMPVTIPVRITALITCIDIVAIAVVTVASAVKVRTIIEDFRAITATTVEKVIQSTMLCIDYLLALRTHLLSHYFLEVHHL